MKGGDEKSIQELREMADSELEQLGWWAYKLLELDEENKMIS